MTVLDGLRAALPDVAHHDGTDPAAAAELARGSDLAVVVVGYTAEHEGEYIGDAGIDLRHLFPEADDPELAAAFRDEPRGRVPTVRPDHVADRPDGLGFSRGGDRSGSGRPTRR